MTNVTSPELGGVSASQAWGSSALQLLHSAVSRMQLGLPSLGLYKRKPLYLVKASDFLLMLAFA